jgi:1-acyl-sn-glycerol-3-phosphate acyltransferase
MSEVASPTSFEADRAGRTAGADPFGLDRAVRALAEPAFRFLHDRYWRVEISGVQHVPSSGPCLLVANHSGALPFDGAMIVTAVDKHVGRAVRFLYDRFVANVPLVDRFFGKVGGVVATRANAETLLELGHPVLLFPEGVPGVAKPFTERYRLRSFSPGFARLAMQADVPVIPVAVVGAEEIYPMLGRAEGVGKALGMPYVPITPFFPVFGLLGALPLPTKWYIRFGRPIRLTGGDEETRPVRARHEAMRVRRTLQAMVTRLKARRRSVFLG